jgi:hypothetical protein
MSHTAGRPHEEGTARPHLEIRPVIREPIAVAVTAQSRNFADRLLVAVRHLRPCGALQHTAHKPYIDAASVPKHHVLKKYGKIWTKLRTALCRGEWLVLRFGRFILGKENIFVLEPKGILVLFPTSVIQ